MPPSRLVAAARTTLFVGFTSGTLLGYEVHERLVPPAARTALLERYRRTYGRAVLRMFGVDWQLEAPHPGVVGPAAGPRLVVANHRSAVDIALLIGLFGGHLVSRADVSGWPLLGRVARRAGTVFVDRQSRASGANAIRTMRRHLTAGATVIVFPEGTTHPGDEVRPFQAGAFAAARGLGAEIVPVGLAYEPGTEFVGMSFGAHLAEVASRPRTRMAAAVGAPLPAEGRSAELAERSRQAVQGLVRAARSHLGEGPGAGTAAGVRSVSDRTPVE